MKPVEIASFGQDLQAAFLGFQLTLEQRWLVTRVIGLGVLLILGIVIQHYRSRKSRET